MKGTTISLRLSNEEKKKLEQDATSAKMSSSQYIRQLIAENTPKADNGKQEFVKELCMLYTVIQEQELDSNEALMTEVEKLCRILY